MPERDLCCLPVAARVLLQLPSSSFCCRLCRRLIPIRLNVSISTDGVKTLLPKTSTEEEVGEPREVLGLEGIMALDSERAVVRRLSTKRYGWLKASERSSYPYCGWRGLDYYEKKPEVRRKNLRRILLQQLPGRCPPL